jgi:hypothetical protein
MLIVTQSVKKFPTYLEPISTLPCSQDPPTDRYPELQELIIRWEAIQFRTVFLIFIVREVTGCLMFRFAFSIQTGSCSWNIYNLYIVSFSAFLFLDKKCYIVLKRKTMPYTEAGVNNTEVAHQHLWLFEWEAM